MAADVTYMKTPAETKLGEQFEASHAKAPATALTAQRAEAFSVFADKGLPHRRIEAWHYTDLRTILRDAFAPAPQPDEKALAKARAYLDAHPATGARAVLLDGVYRADLSSLAGLPAGVTVRSTLDVLGEGRSVETDLLAAEKLGTGETILSLNAAFMQGGIVLSVAADAALETPLDLLSIVSGEAPSAVTTRSLIHVGEKASVNLNEHHVSLGAADSQGNHALVFAVEQGASVEHVAIVADFSPGSLHLGSCLTRLAGEVKFASFTLLTTPGTTRRQTFMEFAGEHTNAALRGVSLLDGRAHADTTLVVTHTAPHCESREYYKTILDGESTGIYQGKVLVSPGAQKTDGKMLSKAIFLADGANMYNKPELEIFADDVVCGHGATVGNLDEDQLFYLRARGIPMKEAQSLLLNAFAADAIEEVADEAVRDDLTRSVEAWLRKRQS